MFAVDASIEPCAECICVELENKVKCLTITFAIGKCLETCQNSEDVVIRLQGIQSSSEIGELGRIP